MSTANHNINSGSNQYMKRNNVLLSPGTSGEHSSAAAHTSKKNKQKTKQFCLHLKRIFKTSSSSTAASHHQQQSPLPRATAKGSRKDLAHGQKNNRGIFRWNFFASKLPFRSHSIGADSYSDTLFPSLPHSNVSGTKKHVQDLRPLAKRKECSDPMSSASTETRTRKNVFQLLKKRLKGEPRFVWPTNDSAYGDRGLPSNYSKDFMGNNRTLGSSEYQRRGRGELPLDDDSSEISVGHSLVQRLEHIAKRKVSIDSAKDIPLFLNSLLMKKPQRKRSASMQACNSSDIPENFKNFRCRTSSVNSQILVEHSTDIDRILTDPIIHMESKCDCEERRIQLMADSMYLLAFKNKNKTLANLMIKELQKIDRGTYHLKSCPLSASTKNQVESLETQIGCSRNLSEVSLYSIQSCFQCQESEEHLGMNVAEIILPLIEQLENEEELHIPPTTINYFLHATCYDHFEAGLIKIIGSECTPKNVARFFYLMRRIFIKIMYPTDENNKTMKNILSHTKRFYQQYYHPIIKVMFQSLPNFLLSGLENNDVD